MKKSILESTSIQVIIENKPVKINSMYTYDKSKKLLYDGKEIVNLSKKRDTSFRCNDK